ncbi:MAG: enolase C-terminal domain-like protein [Mangrovibacterium sp.]
MISRRSFIHSALQASILAGMTGLGGYCPRPAGTTGTTGRKIVIRDTDCHAECEPLIQPMGFKGGYITGLWQTAAWLRSDSGIEKVGLATQSILWSDASVFVAHGENKGNALMHAITRHTLRLLKGTSFENPVSLTDDLFGDIGHYARKITGLRNLRKTFVLNALVGVDLALWQLYAAENGITTFDGLIPQEYRAAFTHHHSSLAGIPLLSYNVPADEVSRTVSEGYFFLKIKIGQPGTQQEMLQKDMERISAIHRVAGNCRTPYTHSGKLLYYLDANGRYEKKETLMRLIDHIQKTGALDQLVLIEEPFPEQMETDVRDIPVRVAADESAHTDRDALERIQMGYGAIALKAIAKTLSMTMKIASVAKQHQIPCFCADLTVNPILVDWNKNVAARLDPFPGLQTGLLESNGHQNYKNWEQMKTYHPFPDTPWQLCKNGLYSLGEDFYAKSGGVLTDSRHYLKLFNHHH